MKTVIPMDNHTSDLVTEKLNAYYRTHESKMDDDFKEAAYRLFARTETDYLLSNKANVEHLKKSIVQHKKGKVFTK